MMMMSAFYGTKPTHLVQFLQCQLNEATVCWQTCCFTRTHFSDSEPTSLCSYSIMLRAQRRMLLLLIFYSILFDPTLTVLSIIFFQHLVFGLKFLLAYLIPDVPSVVALDIRRVRKCYIKFYFTIEHFFFFNIG